MYANHPYWNRKKTKIIIDFVGKCNEHYNYGEQKNENFECNFHFNQTLQITTLKNINLYTNINYGNTAVMTN